MGRIFDEKEKKVGMFQLFAAVCICEQILTMFVGRNDSVRRLLDFSFIRRGEPMCLPTDCILSVVACLDPTIRFSILPVAEKE